MSILDLLEITEPILKDWNHVRLVDAGGNRETPAQAAAEVALASSSLGLDTDDPRQRAREFAQELAEDLPKGFPAWRGFGIDFPAPQDGPIAAGHDTE